jgi:hypothetical protein
VDGKVGKVRSAVIKWCKRNAKSCPLSANVSYESCSDLFREVFDELSPRRWLLRQWGVKDESIDPTKTHKQQFEAVLSEIKRSSDALMVMVYISDFDQVAQKWADGLLQLYELAQAPGSSLNVVCNKVHPLL